MGGDFALNWPLHGADRSSERTLTSQGLKHTALEMT
jgi:hypothetical protein